jgi:hypothetical protein
MERGESAQGFDMPIEQLPIFCYYNKQRFTQFGSMDCANWYGVKVQDSKKTQALYPAMGRKHINFLNSNKLVFNAEPRDIFKSINYFYVVVGTEVFHIDSFYNQTLVGTVSLTGNIWTTFLPVGKLVYVVLTDETNMYIITENGNQATMQMVTDTNITSIKPQFLAVLGSRVVVNDMNTPNWYVSQFNLGGTDLNVSNCFTDPVIGSALNAVASGVVRQFGVLHNQLYIFNDYTCDVWANIVTQITVAGATREFPYKLNTSYNFDFGMADPLSLSIDFGRMCWLAKNTSGIVTFMVSDGRQPEDMDTQAINVLLEQTASDDDLNPFLVGDTDGFLYQYENTIFYRALAGQYMDFGILDLYDSANAIEFNFDTKTWARVIELNGERNRIQKHVYYNNTHLVTVQNDTAIYEMAGNIYYNELRNAAQANPQAPDAFLKYPMRYELVTQQIFQPDYSEFIDDYVEIDFVFGDQTFYRSQAPFNNTVFIVDEASTPLSPVYLLTEDNAFIIAEGSNTPTFDDNHYNALFKPYLELYYSDDGGVTFYPGDLRPFSQLGQYRWRMRWYELAISRNRCYKLVCVSSAPIVILGAVRSTRRASGGAN